MNVRGRPRLESSCFTGVKLYFVPGSDNALIAFSYLCPTLHVEGAPFNLDITGVSMVFSCSTVACCLVHHGRERPVHVSFLSDAAEARGRCAVQPGQFRSQHGLLQKLAVGVSPRS